MPRTTLSCLTLLDQSGIMPLSGAPSDLSFNSVCERMEIKVNFLDNLRLEAKFDDFTVIADQPIRYQGDGSAPVPLITSLLHLRCVLPILCAYTA